MNVAHTKEPQIDVRYGLWSMDYCEACSIFNIRAQGVKKVTISLHAVWKAFLLVAEVTFCSLVSSHCLLIYSIG